MRTTSKQFHKIAWINKLTLSPIFQRKINKGFLLYIGLSILLSACTTAGDAIPQGGPSMAQIYEEAMQQSNGSTLDQARAQITSSVNYDGNNNLSSYTRTSENEINNLFPVLPNPQLVMYVYPHLAGQEEAPVPGYSTAFNLFEREYYALPAEN